MGYADVGFHGSVIETPNLDKLAEEGVRLENFYSCPVSSPTRAGILSGCYPINFGMMRSVVPPYRNYGLDVNVEIIPEMLSRAGYEHKACIGKWHVGHLQREWLPSSRGFDHYVGCYNGAADYVTRDRDGEMDWHLNYEPLHEQGYTTDLIGKHASEYIASVPEGEPYFRYVPFTAPHSPFQSKPEDEAKYKGVNGLNATYAGMVDCLDQNIGKIMAAIEERGDMDNTFILFFSDNGGPKNKSSNGVMRGNKYEVYEGGIRVLAACKWPKGGICGGGVNNERIGYIDVFPTIKALAYGDKHEKVADHNPLDGVNMLPYIKGETQMKDRYWHSYFDQNTEQIEYIGLNYNEWKLVVKQPAPDNEQQVERIVELYKLSADHTGEMELVEDKAIEKRLLKASERFMLRKKEDQIERYGVKEGEFTPPKDWTI